MDHEMREEEVVSDFDEQIARLEAEILETKSLLTSLSANDADLF
jgi:hypothetical protein